MPGGFVGVDVFFVISGYLISGIILDALARGRFSYANFYAAACAASFRRWVVLAALAAGWFLLYADDYRSGSGIMLPPAPPSPPTSRSGTRRATSMSPPT